MPRARNRYEQASTRSPRDASVNLPVLPTVPDNTNQGLHEWAVIMLDVCSVWFEQIVSSLARVSRLFDEAFAEIAGRVRWVHPYVVGNTYEKNDMVYDSGWTMIANKDTTDRAAPQPAGAPIFALPDAPAWGADGSNSSVVYSGHLYSITKGGWLREARVWVPELTGTTNYRFVIVLNPNSGNPKSSIVEAPVLVENGWATLGLTTELMIAGEELLIYIDALNSGGTTPFGPYGWAYSGASQNNPPLTRGWNTDNKNALLRIDKTDLDGVDRTTQLLQLQAGSSITFVETTLPDNFRTYRVNADPIDEGGYILFPFVTQINLGGTIEVGDLCTVSGEIPLPQPTLYKQATNYWPTNQPSWGTVAGYKQYNGVTQPGQENTAFGVDISFQEGSVSEDWDVVAISEGAGGGSSSGVNGVLDVSDVMTASSFVVQNPTGKGVPMQVTFGSPQITNSFSLAADGTFTCLSSGVYDFSLRMVIGRTGGGGESQIYMRGLIDGVQFGDSFHTIVDNARIEMPFTFYRPVRLSAGQQITFEIIRDTDGNNSGGLEPGIPDVAGWNPSPSARLIISKETVE